MCKQTEICDRICLQLDQLLTVLHEGFLISAHPEPSADVYLPLQKLHEPVSAAGSEPKHKNCSFFRKYRRTVREIVIQKEQSKHVKKKKKE